MSDATHQLYNPKYVFIYLRHEIIYMCNILPK